MAVRGGLKQLGRPLTVGANRWIGYCWPILWRLGCPGCDQQGLDLLIGRLPQVVVGLPTATNSADDDRQPMEESAGLRPRWAANQAAARRATASSAPGSSNR